jgi:protein-L-isoaspartate(D-aspartate) O-methyltransferase
MDFEKARFNMIEQQIRPWEVLNQEVLDLLAAVHREDFVPEAYRQLAFADVNIPLGHDQVTMTPKLEARLLQSLELRPEDRILEVGTGCGYLTALLAKSGRHVTSIDLFPEFTAAAHDKLARHGIRNVEPVTADAVHGWPAGAPYDAIAVTGSVPEFDTEFQQQLGLGGRLFIIVGEAPIMEALLITRVGEREWASESLFETYIPPLIGASRKKTFTF